MKKLIEKFVRMSNGIWIPYNGDFRKSTDSNIICPYEGKLLTTLIIATNKQVKAHIEKSGHKYCWEECNMINCVAYQLNKTSKNIDSLI